MDPHRLNRRAPAARPRELRPRWAIDLPGNVFAGPVILEDSIVVLSVRGPGRAGTVQARELQTGALVWERLLSRGSSTAPAPAGHTLVVTTEDGMLRGLDPLTGSTQWETQAEAPTESTPLVTDDAIVLGFGLTRQAAAGGGVAAFSFDGRLRWIAQLGVAVAAPPTRYDSRRVAVATAAGTVHALELASGAIEDLVAPARSDHDSTDAPVVGSPIRAPLVRLDEISVVLATSGAVFAFDDAREARWSWSSSGPVLSDLAASPDAVMLPGADGRLLALDVQTGARLWQVERLGRREPGRWSTPLVVGDVVLAVCSVRELVMVEAREGRRVATAPVEGEPIGVRLDADPSGRLLVGTLGHARRAVCWELEGEE